VARGEDVVAERVVGQGVHENKNSGGDMECEWKTDVGR
jgi:hypothetical protein